MYIKHFLCNHVLFLIMHDGYPVKYEKTKEKLRSFSGNTGFREDNREKRKGNKNFKVPFSLFCFDLYIRSQLIPPENAIHSCRHS